MNVTVSIAGTLLDENAVAIPCGVVAYSYFNDSFQILTQKQIPVLIEKTFISLEYDRTRFHNTDLSK
jgi:hypothetical protein